MSCIFFFFFFFLQFEAKNVFQKFLNYMVYTTCQFQDQGPVSRKTR